MIIGSDFNQPIVIEALTDIKHCDWIAAKKVCPESCPDDGDFLLFQDKLTGMYVVKSMLGEGVLPGVLLDVAVIPFMIALNDENVSELL